MKDAIALDRALDWISRLQVTEQQLSSLFASWQWIQCGKPTSASGLQPPPPCCPAPCTCEPKQRFLEVAFIRFLSEKWLEHSLRMKSYKGNSECLWGNSQKTKVLWPKFLQNTELFLESTFNASPRCSRWGWVHFRSFITTASVVCLCASVCFQHESLALHMLLILKTEHFTHVILLNPRIQIVWCFE